MFVRIVSFIGARDIDTGIRYISDTVVPLYHQQNGFRGTTASADRANGVLSVLSRWDTEADREASEGALDKTRAEAARLIGGNVTVEQFEEGFVELIAPPTIGASLLVRRVSMDPMSVDENLVYFKNEVVPQMKAQHGCLAIRHMIDRQSGEGIVGTAWADAASMHAAAAEGDKRRHVAEARGVMFGEQSKREIVFIDMPQA